MALTPVGYSSALPQEEEGVIVMHDLGLSDHLDPRIPTTMRGRRLPGFLDRAGIFLASNPKHRETPRVTLEV